MTVGALGPTATSLGSTVSCVMPSYGPEWMNGQAWSAVEFPASHDKPSVSAIWVGFGVEHDRSAVPIIYRAQGGAAAVLHGDHIVAMRDFLHATNTATSPSNSRYDACSLRVERYGGGAMISGLEESIVITHRATGLHVYLWGGHEKAAACVTVDKGSRISDPNWDGDSGYSRVGIISWHTVKDLVNVLDMWLAGERDLETLKAACP